MELPDSHRVIFIEDDDALRAATEQALELAGFTVAAFADAEKALRTVTPAFDGMIVSDIRMPRVDGFAVLARVRALDDEIPVVLVTGHGDVPMAVSALHDGAFDFLTKPFSSERLTLTVRRALDRRALVMDNRRLRAVVAETAEEGTLRGTSPAMQRLRAAIRQLAEADLDVLVEGETGTGKELVALMLHRSGRRRARPFIAVNCGALPEGLIEIELFGHAADSVPNTRLSRTGQIAVSSGGTLLLDEIDSMSLAVQAKLLRVLEEREVQPIGADRPRAIDLHVIATSKVDLAAAVASGAFRADLYYRLSAAQLRVPPLRERDGDIFPLFAAFAEEAKRQYGNDDFALDEAIRHHLQRHDWPGNVRELRNYAIQSVLGMSPDLPAQPTAAIDLPARVAAFEASAIESALRRHGGDVAGTLRELGIPRKTFYDKVTRYGFQLDRFRQSKDPGFLR
jgi:two-component system, NtrC family, C4-dicarboxylate transport response regulator DctD